MARGNFESRVAAVRLDLKQKALGDALLVPWSELETAAEEYIDWHSFALWVRALSDAAGEVPDGVHAELRNRCPGFFEASVTRPGPIWKLLDQWIGENRFATAKRAGWFDALMHCAYADLRVEQAWTHWHRTKIAWDKRRPAQWPTLEQWRAGIGAVTSLENENSEKARAVAAAANVDALKLKAAVSRVIENRAFAFWVGCVAQPDQRLDPAVFNEVRNRCPTLEDPGELQWGPVLFLRLIRNGESECRKKARAENWSAALRYHVAHHLRYQRLLHYRQRCHDEWLRVRPISLPPFRAWLAAADAYTVRPTA
jgi:hypothetical protein